ncbi:MAG TPA: YciI family protein [Solirubrobacteraceae bacterium]
MTQYLLSVQGVDYGAIPAQDEMEQTYGAVGAFNEEVKSAGAWVFAGGLQAPDTATVVRIENEETVLTDGPYAESKEHLGGFWVIEAPDLDAAIAWAGKGARACGSPVEVRPFEGGPED